MLHQGRRRLTRSSQLDGAGKPARAHRQVFDSCCNTRPHCKAKPVVDTEASANGESRRSDRGRRRGSHGSMKTAGKANVGGFDGRIPSFRSSKGNNQIVIECLNSLFNESKSSLFFLSFFTSMSRNPGMDDLMGKRDPSIGNDASPSCCQTRQTHRQ